MNLRARLALNRMVGELVAEFQLSIEETIELLEKELATTRAARNYLAGSQPPEPESVAEKPLIKCADCESSDELHFTRCAGCKEVFCNDCIKFWAPPYDPNNGEYFCEGCASPQPPEPEQPQK